MKKLFIIFSLFLVPSLLAEFRYNKKTNQFYSKNAASDVDQNEYHYLFMQMGKMIDSNPGRNMDMQVLTFLRMVGTPAAVRLIHDLEKLIKEARGDLRRLYNS